MSNGVSDKHSLQVLVPVRIFKGALNYIRHVGAKFTERGMEHPQKWIVDGLESAAANQPEATQPPVESPVMWWNGFRRYDERLGTYPSVEESEDTYHDIPLYAGWNAAAASAPSATEAKDAARYRWLASKDSHWTVGPTPNYPDGPPEEWADGELDAAIDAAMAPADGSHHD